MKENTKYHNYRFIGKINVDEIQPWFDFTSMKPWDEGEIPWVLENRVRREILILLSKGDKSFDELYDSLNFYPKPLLIDEVEYEPKVSYQWTKETIENHLLVLEWYELIHLKNDKYTLKIPIIGTERFKDFEKYIFKFSEHWIQIVKQLKDEINSKLGNLEQKAPLYEILVEKAVEKLYFLLKNEGILPNVSNIKTLWAEQLRNIKFEEWVKRNF